LLEQALASAQRGDNIPLKAYEYYGATRPGVTVFEIQPVTPGDAAGADARQGGPPFWGDWWKHLVNP
jgi:hypothetical protein